MSALKVFSDEMLAAHNRLRALHGVGPLKLDSHLSKTAQAYAVKIGKKKTMVHSTANDYGENLAMRTGSKKIDISGYYASLMWYEEIKKYKFNGEAINGTGHFTQMIWKESERVGFGLAKSNDGKQVYVVAHYKPPGNFVGSYKENVPKRLDGQNTVPTEEELEQIKTSSNKNNNARIHAKRVVHAKMRRLRDLKEVAKSHRSARDTNTVSPTGSDVGTELVLENNNDAENEKDNENAEETSTKNKLEDEPRYNSSWGNSLDLNPKFGSRNALKDSDLTETVSGNASEIESDIESENSNVIEIFPSQLMVPNISNNNASPKNHGFQVKMLRLRDRRAPTRLLGSNSNTTASLTTPRTLTKNNSAAVNAPETVPTKSEAPNTNNDDASPKINGFQVKMLRLRDRKEPTRLLGSNSNTTSPLTAPRTLTGNNNAAVNAPETVPTMSEAPNTTNNDSASSKKYGRQLKMHILYDRKATAKLSKIITNNNTLETTPVNNNASGTVPETCSSRFKATNIKNDDKLRTKHSLHLKRLRCHKEVNKLLTGKKTVDYSETAQHTAPENDQAPVTVPEISSSQPMASIKRNDANLTKNGRHGKTKH